MKKIVLLLFIFIFVLHHTKAQTPSSNDTSGISKINADAVCLKPEIEPMYPGGDAAFKRYLSKHFIYTNDDVKGIVVVKFLVGKNSRLTNIEAIAGPDQLKSDAIKMIQKSGLWMPGVCKGKMAAAYKRISISFPNEDSN